jgi:hypothetical protein
MAKAIFLSASVPDPRRAPDYAKTAEPVSITAAVSALLHVTLGRRPLVWGGHPAITPMVWALAEGLKTDYGRWVRLYQSEFFKDEFPEDNERFRNVTYTARVVGDRDASLRLMRQRMFCENQFSAAVFIGGMAGILIEYEMIRELQPDATIVPVVSTGGAVCDLAKTIKDVKSDLREDLDYIALFHRHLEIDVRENRYPDPEKQPAQIADRFWKA